MITVQETTVLWIIVVSVLLVPGDGGRDSLQHEFHTDVTYCGDFITLLHLAAGKY